jgi:hypothetical protein
MQLTGLPELFVSHGSLEAALDHTRLAQGEPVAVMSIPPHQRHKERSVNKRFRRRHSVVLGALLGGVIGAIIAVVITLVGPGKTIWWTPAGLVTGIFGGLVLGTMFAEEARGGREDDRDTAAAEAALHGGSESQVEIRD